MAFNDAEWRFSLAVKCLLITPHVFNNNRWLDEFGKKNKNHFELGSMRPTFEYTKSNKNRGNTGCVLHLSPLNCNDPRYNVLMQITTALNLGNEKKDR